MWIGSVGDALGSYLDMQTSRMKLTAANMANVDTPGYRTQDIDLEKSFAHKLATHGAVYTPKAVDVADLTSRPDGNNVSMDRESMQMAQTQLQFRTGVELLRHQFTLVSDAIRSEGK